MEVFRWNDWNVDHATLHGCTVHAADHAPAAWIAQQKENMKTVKRTPRKREITADDFIALPDEEKNRIVAEIDAETPEERLAKSKHLNKRERAEWKQIQAAMRRGPGRPKLGNGVQKVSVSIERSLMHRVDAYAKAHNMKRSELFASGVARLIREPSRKASA